MCVVRYFNNKGILVLTIFVIKTYLINKLFKCRFKNIKDSLISLYNMSPIHQTKSEELTLSKRGYKLLSKIGEGSYATVYLGEFRATADAKPTNLACKVIDTKKVTKNFVNKFLPRELEILVKISHPYIIHIHSMFQRQKRYYIFMRFAENGDLLEYIIKFGAIVEPQSRFWARQIALAIQYLHKLQIAHRDLKCENILITANHNVKLCDFGFSRFIVDKNRKKVLSDTFCGSLSYASPEILKGILYDPTISDMWAFGVLIFTMLNKSVPFDDTHVTALYENQMKKKWRFRRRVIDRVSPEVKELLRKLLEPNVKKRETIDYVLNSSWILMDSRLKSLNLFELSALKAAKKEEQEAGVRSTLDNVKESFWPEKNNSKTKSQERPNQSSITLKPVKSKSFVQSQSFD